MKFILSLLIFPLFFIVSCENNDNAYEIKSDEAVQEIEVTHEPKEFSSLKTSPSEIGHFVQNRISDKQVMVKGTVIKVLKDDNKGSRHQRFIIKLANDKTILIAHNIDLAPRVANISKNSTIYVYGEYEWNNRGGVIHWTHHAPNGNHIGGWLWFDGEYYG